MPHHDHERIKVKGRVTEIFAHRFVLRNTNEVLLADLTPHGAETIDLRIGDEVAIEGEQKPSEIKVAKLTRADHTFVIAHPHPKPHGPHHHGPHHHGPHHHESADPEVALKTAREGGYEIVGEPRRKPKHFEVLGVKKGIMEELHIELDGALRKTKKIAHNDPKWHEEMTAFQ